MTTCGKPQEFLSDSNRNNKKNPAALRAWLTRPAVSMALQWRVSACQSQNFLNMDDGDDTEFFRSWVAGFSKDESAIVAAGSAGTAEQVANARNKKRGGKKEKLVDVSFLRTYAECCKRLRS